MSRGLNGFQLFAAYRRGRRARARVYELPTFDFPTSVNPRGTSARVFSIRRYFTTAEGVHSPDFFLDGFLTGRCVLYNSVRKYAYSTTEPRIVRGVASSDGSRSLARATRLRFLMI